MTKNVAQLMGDLESIGRDPLRGGYSRPGFGTHELRLLEWFVAEAESRGLDIERDRNGITWAWWDLPESAASSAADSDDKPNRAHAIATGSHLDSVPGGGAFDGPLGVASALASLDQLQEQERNGTLRRTKPLVIAVFPEEEGSRFGVACLGSRLITGAITPQRALALTDRDGSSFADAARAVGLNPEHMGADPARLSGLDAFLELHVEQGKFLGKDPLGPAVAVASSILGHGRWRFSFAGQGNHAGTTLMADRHDPMIAAAAFVVAVRDEVSAESGARGTVGRLEPIPGGTNVVASRVDVWLDVRHPDDVVTAGLVERLHHRATALAAAEGCTVTMSEESMTGTVNFDGELARGLLNSVERVAPGAQLLPSGAGHDAGILASAVPTGMIFTRNPTGISHAPEEYVEDADAQHGVKALTLALADLLTEEPQN
ncbi:N-carbamoyl-L-amino-acid hydrolase [Neomicrococcus aestuarii]|uniref:N-carbamoyl-L-amino-acid hydrolase n=1 Tax=Neomicrococcus aestuarii TaxID=556325 RepID=A0A7W8TRC6_9MICC|nr:allantoate amidohydrolase [Neomicrococcus aestuarii]MBB5511497.1 N-carbamoyl-L-amino-acid hydrolase [Neomicrococcus aestuarii]